MIQKQALAFVPEVGKELIVLNPVKKGGMVCVARKSVQKKCKVKTTILCGDKMNQAFAVLLENNYY